jgi:hypothetical protein
MTNRDRDKDKDKDKDSIKIKGSDDIELNGIVYFISDKYIENKFLSYEYKKLYKLILVLYLDLQIKNNKIENITTITKLHISNAIITADKLISYIFTGKVYITNLTSVEKYIIDKIPESLIYSVNHNILEKIDL